MSRLFASKNRLFRGSVAAIAIFGLFLPISLPQYALVPDNNELWTYSIDWTSAGNGIWLAAEASPVYPLRQIAEGGKDESQPKLYYGASQDEIIENGPAREGGAGFFAGFGLVAGNAIVKTNPPVAKKPTQKINIIVTAYSSTPDQTDDTPFITASNSRVRDGVVANNSLPFGTRVKFPRLFGEKIFIIEDRMAPKNSHKVDIWMPTRQMALNFGVKRAEMEIL